MALSTTGNDTSDPLLCPEEVAQRCGLSRRAVYDAIRRGELPAMRLCSRLRIRRQDFEAWLAGARVAPEDPDEVVSELRRSSPLPSTRGSFRALMLEDDEKRSA
ncbi:MAG: Helix-turn-helix domain [Solirubrobacterales bacterium]|nr:Helix-turn-helix domain [Solirubrobacterales bacterium]